MPKHVKQPMPTDDASRVHGGDSPGIEAVTTDRSDRPIQRDELTSLLSLCGTLAGLCIGIVAFINASSRGAATLIDDVLATCAATFLLCIYLITFAFRTRSRKRALLLTQVVELLFLATLTVMTAAGFFMVYTIW